MPRKTLSTEEFIKRSKEIHGEKYDYSKTILITTKIKVTINCPIHGYFEVMPFNHLLNKQGCKKCYFKSRMLSMENINRRLSEKHNNFYTYNLDSNVKVTDKIEIICPIHGKFFQLLSNHLNGQGCNKCGIDRSSKFRKLTNGKFIKKALKVHGCKYDYSLVDYKSSNNKIKIICKIHGVFLQNPTSHLVGAGCPHCSSVGNKSKKMTTDTFKSKANKIHLNYYNYDKVKYIDSHTKVTITCLKHGDFKQEPGSHIYSKSGCPSCNLSKGEISIRETLIENGILFKPQHKFPNCKYKNQLPFDFYIPLAKIAIEYQGEQHFTILRFLNKDDGDKKLKSIQITDKIKKEYCKNNNIKLFEITYKDNISIKMKELLDYVKVN